MRLSFSQILNMVWAGSALWLGSSAWSRELPTFASVAERAKLSVVNIRTDSQLTPRRPRLDPYQFFLSERLPANSSVKSLGSGVIVSDDGLIMTNYHVIADATSIQVWFADKKKKVEATLVGSDPKTDLALLRVKLPPGLRAADLGDSEKLRVGDWVLAIGNPFGYEHTVTSGIISAKGRVIGTGPYDSFLQTDAAIHPGNSGGPIIDMRGRVVGIAAAVDAEAPGIGFAIPINTAKSVIRDLKQRGAVIRPWLGIVAKNVVNDDGVQNSYDPVGAQGVVVANLVIDSPAHKAGLKMGDLIVGMNKRRIGDSLQLQKLISSKRPSESIQLRIYRRGQGYKEISLALGTTPKAEDLPAEKDLL